MHQCWASDLAKRPLFPEISARLQAMQAGLGELAMQVERGQTVRQRGEAPPGPALAAHVTRNPAFLDFVGEDDSTVLADSDT